MTAQSTGAAVPIHLRADDYKDGGGGDLDSDGLRVREVVGPSTSIAAVGPLVVVHDRRFAPRSESERQPHRGMEQLFYVLEGTMRHTDSVERMAGTLHRGDLGILTEGREGMGHVERNDGDLPSRVYVMGYPASPMPDVASFQVIRDASMPRVAPHAGAETKILIERSSTHVHGQVHEAGDTRFEVGGALPIVLDPGQGAVLFCLEGRFQVDARDATPATTIGVDETVLFAPAPEARRVVVDAQAPGRLLHVVTGTGFGFRLQDAEG